MQQQKNAQENDRDLPAHLQKKRKLDNWRKHAPRFASEKFRWRDNDWHRMA